MGTLVRFCRLQTKPTHTFPHLSYDEPCVVPFASCRSASRPQMLRLRNGFDGHHVSSQVRHSRVTAVWDDEPVPAVPAPRDQTPALPGHTGQHTTQASLNSIMLLDAIVQSVLHSPERGIAEIS